MSGTDETAAMVNYLVNTRQIRRISILYQDDSFGQTGYMGLTNAMTGVGLSLRSEGKYVRNTEDVESAVTAIAAGKPEAIVMIGTYKALAKFVKMVKRSSLYNSGITFLTVSFVGSVAFAHELGDDYENVIITQVVPLPSDTSFKIVANYGTAMSKYKPHIPLDFISLEGYLAATLVINVLQRLPTISRSHFLNTIYDSSEFYIGGLRFGPYEDCVHSPSCTTCNQGLHKIWATSIGPNATFYSLPKAEWTWSTCISDPNTISSPIIFGQSAVFTGLVKNLGIEVRAGIVIAFNEYNAVGGFNGRLLQLISLDDQYEPNPAYNNTIQLVQNEKVFGLIGYVGTPTTSAAIQYINTNNIPLVGAYTGASFLRDPFQRNVINIRSSYNDETAAMVNYLQNTRGISRISIFYQNDSFGLAGYNGLMRSMNALSLRLQSSGKYTRNTLDVESAVTSIAEGEPEAIVMIGTALALAKFVKLVKSSPLYEDSDELVFMTVSFVGSIAFASALGGHIDNVYITEVVPHPYNDLIPLIPQYRAALNETAPELSPSTTSLEGYIAGKLVSEVLSGMSASRIPLTRDSFLSYIYKMSLFSLKGEPLGVFNDVCKSDDSDGNRRILYYLPETNSATSVTGGLTQECCNTGIKEIIIVDISKDVTFTQIDSFSYPLSCSSDPTTITKPLLLATEEPNDESQLAYFNGLSLYVDAVNSAGGFSDRKLILKVYNNSNYEMFQHNLQLIRNEDNIFAIVGFGRNFPIVDYTNWTIPIIGIRSGESSYRTPYNELILNLRPSLVDELYAIAELLATDVTINKISVIVQWDNVYWKEAYSAFSKYLVRVLGKQIYSIVLLDNNSYRRSVEESKSIFSMNKIQNADVVVCLSDTAIVNKYMYTILTESDTLKVYLPNDVDVYSILESVTDRLGQIYVRSRVNEIISGRVYLSQLFPTVNQDTILSKSDLLFRSYQRAMNVSGMNPNSNALEGYITAAFISNVLSTITGDIDKSTFIRAVYTEVNFNLGGYLLGPIGKACQGINSKCASLAFCNCNQLSHAVYQMIVSDPFRMSLEETKSHSYETCGILFQPIKKNYVPAIVVAAVVAFIIAVVLLVTSCVVFRVYRARQMKYAPKTGYMAIAFTDVQSSTKLWQKNANEMEKALKLHNQVLRSHIASFHGFEIKTQGDSFMVAFSDPEDALLWACAVQEALVVQEWSSNLTDMYDCRVEFDSNHKMIFKGLRVRIGIHYGEAQRTIDAVTRRPDYYGTTVNKAARCEGEAKGGQVLITEEMFSQIRNLLLEDIVDTATSDTHEQFEKTENSSKLDPMQFKAINYQRRRRSSSISLIQFGPEVDPLPKELMLRFKLLGTFILKGLQDATTLYEVIIPRLRGRKFDVSDHQKLESSVEKMLGKTSYTHPYLASNQVLPTVEHSSDHSSSTSSLSTLAMLDKKDEANVIQSDSEQSSSEYNEEPE
jgi:adenylate cyclase